MQFILPLEEEQRSQRQSTTLHMMLAFLLFGIGVAGIGLFFGFTVLTKNFETHGAYNSFLLFGIASLLASVALLVLVVFQKTWIRQRQNNLLFRIIELVLLGGSSVLFFLNGWKVPAALFALMGGVVIFAITRERRATTAGNIIIEDSGITIRSDARSRRLPWSEIDGVLLRFGILSVECTGNRLIQRNVAGNPIDPAVLSQYCQERIAASQKEKVLNDW